MAVWVQTCINIMVSRCGNRLLRYKDGVTTGAVLSLCHALCGAGGGKGLVRYFCMSLCREEVVPIAEAADRTAIGGISLLRTVGLRNLGSIAMPRCRCAFAPSRLAVGTGIGHHTAAVTIGMCCHSSPIPDVGQCIGSVTAGTMPPVGAFVQSLVGEAVGLCLEPGNHGHVLCDLAQILVPACKNIMLCLRCLFLRGRPCIGGGRTTEHDLRCQNLSAIIHIGHSCRLFRSKGRRPYIDIVHSNLS